jgi:hypothetical protein
MVIEPCDGNRAGWRWRSAVEFAEGANKDLGSPVDQAGEELAIFGVIMTTMLYPPRGRMR